jgi:membrane-bound serine protease (ClpP class)
MIAWVMVLFAAGMALILAEFIVPGMICGILGGAFVIASGVIGLRSFPEYGVIIIIVELVGVVLTVGLGMYLLARTKLAKGLILEQSQQADAGWVAAETDASLMGAHGRVFTALRPAGTIIVSNKRIDAVSDGSFIDEGAQVRVIEVHGSRVVVEKVAGS